MQIVFESIIDFVMSIFSGSFEKGYHNPKENFRQPVPYYLCKLTTQTTYWHHELQER